MKPARFVPLGIPILIFAFSTLLYAGVPQMINYQGKITTPAGALVDTTVGMTFTIYDDSSSGNVLWADTLDSVAVEKGIFSVLLGSVNPIPDSVFDGNVRYLGTKVGTDTEMSPRKAMVSVPYALRTGGDGDWTISGSDIYSAVSGNVGIGTSTPSSFAKLHVTTPVVTTFRLSTPSNDFSGMSGIRLDTPSREWLISNQNSISNGLAFSDVTASQHRLFISTDGNVGIGTISPAYKLDVAGTAKATDFECSGCIDAGDINTSQVQRRVSGSCSAGSSIRVINSDGTVTCEPDDAGDAVASCSDVNNCNYIGSIRHFQWMSSIYGTGDIYDNGYVKIQKTTTNRTFKLYCGHPSGCTYVYYLNGVRTGGILASAGTVSVNMTTDGNDARFLFAKRANGMDMLECDVFDTNGNYLHFICHDTK
jgi:hypothetical protein